MNKCLFLPFLFLPLCGVAQIANISNSDSICAKKINKDKDGRILSWYNPETPGAGYGHVVKLASEFMLQDCPIEPKTGLPLYLVTCCFQGPQATKDRTFVAEDWPHNPACVFAGCVRSLAEQYRVYSGDENYLALVRGMLDYQLANGTTPADWKWPNVPFASSDAFSIIYQGSAKYEDDGMRGDGLHGIEPDKIGELGFAYLRFYEITGEHKYLDAAIHCADALSAHVRNVIHEDSPFIPVDTKRSPWPFRVNARNGIVISDYCSNVIDPVKLFDELLRIKEVISLPVEKSDSYRNAREAAWNWLFSRNGPMVTFIWNAYFEDVTNDPDRSNRLQITPMETAKYLISHPDLDKSLDVDVTSLIRWVANAFKTEGMDAIKEQTWCYEPMGSHTSRYGAVCAMYYERTKDPWYKDQAFRFLNVATYMTYENGVVCVGPNWPGSWFSDGYSDYIRHFMDAMAAVPEWAPAGEDHLLRSSSVVQKISYADKEITYATFDKSSQEVLRLNSKPREIRVAGSTLKESKTFSMDGWTWKPLPKGGVVYLNHTAGDLVTIKLSPESTNHIIH